ncbi:MAG TPA: DM9 repeat-containing protein, partial [Acidobacteriaceae bacterium]|nr:DM9 repeat-containing protein [Acidobacteriaceae bacterium]
MRSFARFHRPLLAAVLGCCSISAIAQNGSMLGQSIRWRQVQAPFTPDQSNGAIAGGPGSDPNPGTPMFICRAQIQGSVVPGKWVQGNCNVPYGGSEQIMSSYEVAYGSAVWGPYQGGVYGLAQTGSNADGSPLYSCRVHYAPNPGTDYGYQPGKLVSDGT